MALNLSHHAESKYFTLRSLGVGGTSLVFFEAFGGLALRSFSEEGKQNADKPGRTYRIFSGCGDALLAQRACPSAFH